MPSDEIICPKNTIDCFLISSRKLFSGVRHVPVKFSPILQNRLGNSLPEMSEISEVLRKT